MTHWKDGGGATDLATGEEFPTMVETHSGVLSPSDGSEGETLALDPAGRQNALERADAKRLEAFELTRQAQALIRGAEVIERTWGIQPPCHLCGRRKCSH